MNYKPLILAALVPLVATVSAGESLQNKIDVQKLQEDLRVTDVIGASVMRGGEDVGDVEDIIISNDGGIDAVLVDGLDNAADENNNMNGDPEQQPVSVPQEKSGGGIGTQTDEGFTKIQWNQVSYDPQQDSLRLNAGGQGASGSSSQAQTSGYDDMRASSTSAMGSSGSQQSGSGSTDGTFRASEIVGMEVHLSDAQSFGEVEDVLVNQQQGKASALLVDAWEGFDKQTYALPVELNAINREDNTLTYNYTESEVVALQEYEEQ